MSIELSGIPVLKTERLILRAPMAKDEADAVTFYMSDRAKHVGGPFSRKDAYYAFTTEIGHWVTRGFGMWAVTEKGEDTCLGFVGCWYPDTWPEKEIGWVLWAAAEGRGFGYEAALATRHHAYNTLGWTTAVSYIEPANVRSIRLAERLGAVRDDAAVRPDPEDLVFRHPAPEELS